MKKTISTFMAVVMIGCTPSSQQLTLLDAAVAAADAAIVALSASGQIDPVIAAEVVAVITPIPAAANAIINEFNSADAPAVKVAKIGALSRPVILALSTLEPRAQVYVTAVLAAWQAFLAVVDPTTTFAPKTVLTSTQMANLPKTSEKLVKVKITELQSHLADATRKFCPPQTGCTATFKGR